MHELFDSLNAHQKHTESYTNESKEHEFEHSLERSRRRALLALVTSPVIAQSTPSFSVTGAEVYEGAGFADVVVTSTLPVNVPTTIEFATSSGTAINGVDYVGQYKTLRFDSGESRRTVRVKLVDDTRIEQTEQFNVRVFHPSAGDVGRATAAARIEDDDADETPTLSVADGEVLEGARAADRRVRLSSPSARTIQVALATVPGSAQNKLDFYGVCREVEFLPGATEVGVRITVLDDALAEESEQFDVSIQSVTATPA